MNSKRVWWSLSSVIGLFILIQALLDSPDYGHLDVVYHANLLRTENDLVFLINALENFRKDMNRYPSTKGGLQALLYQSTDSEGWKGPYLTKQELALLKDFKKDPWGTKYIYIYPAKYGSVGYDLYSCGKNQRDDHGQQDDISNWQGADEAVYGKKQGLFMDPLSQVRAWLLLLTIALLIVGVMISPCRMR